ncbi:MAG TPA: DNA repair protein RecN [Thermoanaerobaculia bacterium]|nr:DNA repair protein RecN [Thermoanaerobaculia bacterium]
MLRRLLVKNLAIVEDLEMELGGGLTVVTGETGAGKSILVDALALLAGARGSSDLVREGAAKLVVAGEFDGGPGVGSILAEAGLPVSETLLLRREVSADGRGRAFVEDEPAALRTLTRLAERLVRIYGQNSELELTEPEAALELLDAFARSGAEREAVAAAAAAWRTAGEDLKTLEAARSDRAGRLEHLDYQIHEIEAVSPGEQEEEELMTDRQRLLHADRIRLAGEAALVALSEGEGSAADRLGAVVRAFADLAEIDPRETGHRQEAEDLKRRIADLAAAARDAAASIEADPDRLTAVETRLEKISRLKRRHGVPADELPALLARLKTERLELSHIEDALDRRQQEVEKARAAYVQAAARLSAKRRAASGRLSSAVERELRALAMEKARFRVALTETPAEVPRASGVEAASLMVAPNPGEPEKPVERIASGGELSRLQLAIRSVAAGPESRARTLVFDEVDAGIGGRTAEVVGKKLRELAREDQVLCVTHVPQIAALADRHFLAEKSEQKGRTVARVRLLAERERVVEVARMLAGETVPDTALKHARALLQAART